MSEQVLRLHARLIDRFGGAPGARNPGALDAATLVWLEVNGHGLGLDAEQRYQLTMRVADGSLGMIALTTLLREAIA